LKQHEIS